MTDKSLKTRVPALLIDFSQPIDYSIHYPLTPASKSASIMARAQEHNWEAKWSAEAVRMVDSQTGLYNNIPITCRGKTATGDEGCPYAEHCPFSTDLVEEDYIGKNCPVEVVEAYKTFAGYVVDLEIQPSDYTDIMMVVDLVRLHILLMRTDLYQKTKSLHEKKVGGIHQTTGTVHYDKVPNLGYGMARQIRQDMDLRLKQLVATRLEKFKRDALRGQDANTMASIIARVRAVQAAANQIPDRKPRRRKREDAIDADFSIEGVNDGEE